MDNLKPPPPFAFEGNLSHGWKVWSRHFDFFLAATEAESKSEKVKTSILLTAIGPKGRDIHETFAFTDDDDALKLEPVLAKFKEYCNSRKNLTILRHIFFMYRQHEGETFADFVIQLKKLAAECEFDALKDSLIKDMVCGGI